MYRTGVWQSETEWGRGDRRIWRGIALALATSCTVPLLMWRSIALLPLASSADRSELGEMLWKPWMLWILNCHQLTIRACTTSSLSTSANQNSSSWIFQTNLKKPKFAQFCFKHLSSHVSLCKAAQIRRPGWKNLTWWLTASTAGQCRVGRFSFLQNVLRVLLLHRVLSGRVQLRRLSVKKLSRF